jgi:hypothetical protein
MNWYYQSVNPEKGEALAEIKKTNVALLPIKNIDLKDKSQKLLYDEIERLVETIMQLKNSFSGTKLPIDHNRIANRITASENKIDKLVFELYGLNKKDIEIIEKNM